MSVELREACLICSSPAPHHKHYGAVSCYSCRVFFRRGRGNSWECVSGSGGCILDQNTRTHCKKCRYERCLEVGMDTSLIDKIVRIRPVTTLSKTKTHQYKSSHILPKGDSSACHETYISFHSQDVGKLQNIEKSHEEDIVVEEAFNVLGVGKPGDQTSQNTSTLLPIKRMKEMPYPVATVISRKQVPVVTFTLEEEFCLSSIRAKKKLFYDSICDKLMENKSEYADMLKGFIASVKKNTSFYMEDKYLNDQLQLHSQTLLKLFPLLLPEMSVLSPNMTAILINNTIPSFSLIPCTLMYSKDLGETYYQQLNRMYDYASKMEEWSKEVPDLQTMRSANKNDYESLTSPWAVSMEDEDYFDDTMVELAKIIGEDIKLSTLYSFLILITPSDSANLAKVSRLKEEQNKISLMMYRYLAVKEGVGHDGASMITNKLLALVSRLHLASQIFYKKRIRVCSPDNLSNCLL